MSYNVPIWDGEKNIEAEVLNTIGFDQDTIWGVVALGSWIFMKAE